MLMGLCLAVLSLNALGVVNDPNIISGAVAVNTANEALEIVPGGFVLGALSHVDRTYVFEDVAHRSGIDFVKTVVDDKTDGDMQYQITVNKSGTLYLFIDNRVGDDNPADAPTLGTAMSWVDPNGFTPAGFSVVTGGAAFTAYEKAVTAGTYTLLEQNDGGSRVTYFVAAVPDNFNYPPEILNVPSSVQVAPGGNLVVDANVIDYFGDNPGVAAYLWEQLDENPAVTFSPDAASEDVTISFPGLGVYTLQLTATDNDGGQSAKTIEVSVQIPTFAIDTDNFAEICNDTTTGPDSTSGASSTYARNYTNEDGSQTRRRLFYYNWDISSLKSSGEVFFNSYLTMNANSLQNSPILHVYGVKEEYDNFTLNGYATWNNMPGVIPNLPLSTLVDESVLDREDIVPLMEVAYNDYGSTKEWVSFPVSPALSEFMNADTDGSIMLMFAVLRENDNIQLYSPGYKSAPTYTETGENLQGVIIQTKRAPATWATKPIPQINSTQNIELAELSWTNPPAVGTLTCEAWIGQGDPNTPVGSGDGFVSLPVTGNTASLSGYTLEVGNTYNWVVNCTDDGTGVTTQGFTWSFYVGNGYPVINVADLFLWLGNHGDPGSATAAIDATVTDEGLALPEPILLWEQVSGPATVAIDPNDVEDITLTLPKKGTYVFKLTADDGELISTATTNVLVADTPCDAAKAKPGYVATVGDLNNDCYVNLEDFAKLAQNWLVCHPFMDAPCE